MRKALIVIALATLLLGGCASTQSYTSASPGVYYANSEVNVVPAGRFGSYSYPWGINSTYYSYGRNRIFLSRRSFSGDRAWRLLDQNGQLPDWQYGTTDRGLTSSAPSNGRKGSKGPGQAASLPGNHSGYYVGGGAGALRPIGEGRGKFSAPSQRLHSISQTGHFGSTVKRSMKHSRSSNNYGSGKVRSKSSRGGRSYGSGRSSRGGRSHHGGGHSSKGSHSSSTK